MAESTEQKTGLQVPTTLKSLIEALVFAAHEPLTIAQLKAIVQGDNRNDDARQLDGDAVREIVAELNKEYSQTDRPYRILQVAGGYQFATMTEYADWIGSLYKEQGRRKLSQSGIETLAIVAYKQPITKGEIESIRGVNCDYVLKTLLEKELITVTGRAETVGRPLLYGSTREFLKYFTLNEITDLPRPREIEEILGESQFETERRMLEAQSGAEQMKKEQEDFKSRLPHIPKRKPELEQRNVEIVPRKKMREIKTVSKQQHDSLEAAGQEKIEFQVPPEEARSNVDVPLEHGAAFAISPDTLTPEEKPKTAAETEMPVTESGHGTTAPQNEIAGEQTIDLERVGDKTESPSIEEATPEIPPMSADVVCVTESQEAISSPNIGQEPEARPLPLEDVGSPQIQRTKWQTWKEKLTGFIKKIFG